MTGLSSTVVQRPRSLGPTSRVRLPGRAPGACPAIYHNRLTPNITPSSSPGTLSTGTLHDCWQSNNFPFFRPTNGTTTCTLLLLAPSWPPTSKSKNPPLVRDGPLKWPHRRVGVLYPNSRGHTKASENFARRARRVPGALTNCHRVDGGHKRVHSDPSQQKMIKIPQMRLGRDPSNRRHAQLLLLCGVLSSFRDRTARPMNRNTN